MTAPTNVARDPGVPRPAGSGGRGVRQIGDLVLGSTPPGGDAGPPAPPAPHLRGQRLWLVVFCTGLVVTVADAAFDAPAPRNLIAWGWLVCTVLAIEWGARTYRPRDTRPWHYLSTAVAFFLVGWIARDLHTFTSFAGAPTGPNLADLAQLIAYPLILIAVVLLARARRIGGDLDSLLDALIVGSAIAFVAWRAVLSPAFHGSEASRRSLAVAAAIPAIDLLLIVIMLRVTLATTRRSWSWAFLLLGLCVETVGDLVYALATANLSSKASALPVWVAGYVLIAAAALHPSMVELTEPTVPAPPRLGPVRIGLLGMALLTTPAVILLDRVQHMSGVDDTLLISSGLITLVVLVRLVSLARQAERAADRERTREQRFESLVRNSSDLLGVVDARNHLTYVSPAVETVLGYSHHDILGANVARWFHPDDLERARVALDGLAEGEDSGRLLLRLRHADGSWRWVEANAVNLLGDPSVAGVVVNCRDVTERVEAEHLVRASVTQQAAAATLGREALAGADFDQLAERTVHLVRSTLDVQSCFLFVQQPDDTVVCKALDGPGDVLELPGDLSEHPLLAQCLESEEPIHVVDTTPTGPFPDAAPAQHRPLAGGEPDDTDGPATHVPPEGPAMLGVRVADREHAIGALVVRSGVPRAFTAGEASFLQSMSSALGLAVGRREVETAARHQALHDALTGLPNRTLFLDRLESALARLERSRTTIAVLFLDLDHFKVVNDSLGHNSGDRILVTVAERLSSILRPGDTVARFGGDEFTILCDGLVDASEAVDIAERIRAGLATALEVGRAELHQTVSIGIAVATGLGAHPEAMLRDADAAMYRAKERGRNRVELFDDTMRDRAITRLRTEIALRRAITQDELVLHYQPVIDLTSGDMVGAEALIRWQHPREGLVAPARFIPVAEETGLISEISQWVLEHALQQVADWNRSAEESTAVSLNVSARTLASRQFPDRVAEALEATGAPPELVCLEITESALMDDVERSLETLGRLRDLGVTLAVDDFGTGYSSLTYLKRLPVDVLKIDGSFVDGLGREAEDSAIVAAIVTLAATLGQQAIAEGVETALQLGELQRLDCPLAQGFLFSRAVPADDLSRLRHIDLGTATSVSS